MWQSDPSLSTRSIQVACQILFLLGLALVQSSTGAALDHSGPDEPSRPFDLSEPIDGGRFFYPGDQPRPAYGGYGWSKPQRMEQRIQDDIQGLQFLRNLAHTNQAMRPQGRARPFPEVSFDQMPTEVLTSLVSALNEEPDLGSRAKRNKHLRLSLTNNIDVLREKLYAEIARRNLLRSQSQVDNANEGLASIG